MAKPGDVISYLEMCTIEGTSLQRGMNFRLRSEYSVILMSLRPNAPYSDRVEDNGHVLIYEGHDVSKTKDTPVPKLFDQPLYNPGGSLTQNGLFFQAAKKHPSELVKVYEKLHAGIWVYNGLFKLLDAWDEKQQQRKVFKFKLELVEKSSPYRPKQQSQEPERDRMIPPEVKITVWKRDKGKCVLCGSKDNLHFDHIIPFSKGGSSLTAENIQILCAKHNLAKHDKIE